MELNIEIETEDGPAKFYGTFDSEEMKFMLQYALIHMIREGVLPLSEKKADRTVSYGGNS